MSEKEWEAFFELLEKVVDLPLPTVEAKMQAVSEAAENCGGNALGNLDEFTSWDWSEVF